MTPWAASLALVAAGLSWSCSKVELVPVDAGFVLADATWFEEEETLFVFYEVTARQGLGDPSVIEVSYSTDEERVDWTPVDDLPAVHEHLPVDCGMNALCGSASVAVPNEPRDVRVRLRYHRDGELALEPTTVFNVIGPGPAWQNRSLVIYGVFDRANDRVQWRSRHQFPTLRNEQVEAYGLRRRFRVENQQAGTAPTNTTLSRYGYGTGCPDSLTPTPLGPVETSARAVFNEGRLPAGFGGDAMLCADATVWDAAGPFVSSALARKNPEVRPAFPLLRSPVEETLRLEFFLQPCDRVISDKHEALQRQRLLMQDPRVVCIDDWDRSDFVDRLVNRFETALSENRSLGYDMVLLLALHQDEPGVVSVLEEALLRVVPPEADRSTPRLAGAFVFDSDAHNPRDPDLRSTVLWCPASLSGGSDSSPSPGAFGCAIAPENPEFELGPFTFGSLPILPSRSQYLDFLDSYGEDQAGEVTRFSVRAPEFTAGSDHVPFGDIGVVTFLDDEFFSADSNDAFSYCPQDTLDLFAFRTPTLSSEDFLGIAQDACREGGLPPEVCTALESGVLPLALLPEWHRLVGENTYDIGIFWQFPFLVQMEFEVVAAGSLSAVGLSIPFGFAQDGETFLGTPLWTEEAFALDELLTQCRRFCDHPTFDDAGVYQVRRPFDPTYATTCYAPRYPAFGDSGFPRDP